MSIKTFIRNLRGLGKDDVVTRADFSVDHAPDWVFETMAAGMPIAGGVSAEMEVPGLNRAADNVLMVSACIMARRNAIAKVPVRLSDAEGNMIESGQIFDLFSNPNQTMTWGEYARILETYKTLYNFVAVGLVGQGDNLIEQGEFPTEMVPLNPSNLYPIMGTHKPTGTPLIVQYRYADQYTGSVVMFQPHQVLVHRGFNPHAPLASLAPLTTLRRTMQADLAARELNLAMLQNNAVPAGVLENQSTMTKDQAEEVLNFWDQRMKGYTKRGKIMASWGGLKYNPVGLTPVEMEYINGLKFLRTDYYMIFRIPPEMVYESMPVAMGAGNQAKDSTKTQWWEDEGLCSLQILADLHQPVIDSFGPQAGAGRFSRLMTRTEACSLQRWAARASERGPTRSSGIKLWFDENQIPCLVQHRLATMSQAKDLLNMGYKPDDVNDYLDLGLPPHPDNKARLPSNVVLLDAPQGGSGQTTKEIVNPATEQPSPITRVERLLQEHCAARTDRAQKVHDFIVEKAAPAAKRWSRFFVEQRQRVLARIGTLTGGASATRAQYSVVADMMEKIFPRSEEDASLVARMSPLWTKAIIDGVKLFESESEPKVSITLTIGKDPRLQKALEKRVIQGLKVNDTTEEDLRAILATAFDEGLTTVEIGDKIAEYYAANGVGEESARSMTAAMTQTTGCVNDGLMLAAQDVGGLEKYWIHGNPKEPRPSHLQAAETYSEENAIPLDEPFVVDGEELDAPGDESGSMENVCNCTCILGFTKAKSGATEQSGEIANEE